MNVLTPVFAPMRRRSSAFTAPSVRIQFPSSTRDRNAVHSAHIAILTAVAWDSRAIRRVSSVRANSGRRFDDSRTSLIASGEIRLGSSRSELARDLVHDVVDQIEEVDAALRSLQQLFDLAGRPRAALRRLGLDLHAARGALTGRRLHHRGGTLRTAAGGARSAWRNAGRGASPSLRWGTCSPGAGWGCPAYPGGPGTPAARGKVARAAARAGPRVGRPAAAPAARARAGCSATAAANNNRCAATRTQRPPGNGCRG